MNKVLIIGKTWPEPKTTGAGVRMMQIINFFKSENYIVSFASSAAKSAYSETLEKTGVNSYPIQVNDSSFDSLVRELNPNIVVFDRFHTEEQFSWRIDEIVPNALKILDSEDLHFLREARASLVKQNITRFTNQDCYEAALELETTFRELNAMYRSDLTLIISQFELKFLKNYFHFPDYNLLHFPLLTSKKINTNVPFSDRKNLIFIGNFNHLPNIDAVRILNEIFPSIREKLPQIEIHIFGAYMPESIKILNKPKQGFKIKGWTDNLAETISKYRLMLAPLRFGAGIKSKVLESLNSGTPVISTKIGFEGISEQVHPGYCGEIDKEFVNNTIELYNNEELWLEKAAKGKKIVNTLTLNSSHIESRINQFEMNLKSIRRKNIIQRMLLLSNNKSYKYLSKYIEIKNKK